MCVHDEEARWPANYYASFKELGKEWMGMNGDYALWENKTISHVSDIHNGGTKIE